LEIKKHGWGEVTHFLKAGGRHTEEVLDGVSAAMLQSLHFAPVLLQKATQNTVNQDLFVGIVFVDGLFGTAQLPGQFVHGHAFETIPEEKFPDLGDMLRTQGHKSREGIETLKTKKVFKVKFWPMAGCPHALRIRPGAYPRRP